MIRNANQPEVRCAIYTRKSTEEGLEQEFNSLDAQREAGEAYIKSQQQEGWVCVPDSYDDGGFTGANMDRPALKRLMADIEAGKVNCVVVYKVDRLSRSLMDFSRIIESFDRYKVAFVSVTQAFNTASSMGRLILNVLLSFAQFEREMISERTRDKIAAARRKGKWAGGMPVLGYTVEDTKLIVDEAEALQVQEIFRLYLQHESAMEVAGILNERGWRTKQWTTHKETERGGKRFGKNAVYKILTNVVYLGQLRYKAEIHNGEHAAIVDEELFRDVQRLLDKNRRNSGRETRNKHRALLRGMMHCKACDCGMSHSYTKKGSKFYRYYVCQHAQSNGWQECPAPSLPAVEIEKFVVKQIKLIGRDEAIVRDTLATARRKIKSRTKSLVRERAAIRRKLGEYVEDQQPTDCQQRLAEIEAELLGLTTNDVGEKDVTQALGDFDELWETLMTPEKTRIIELLIERVSYDSAGGQLDVTYRPTGIHTLAAEFKKQKAITR